MKQKLEYKKWVNKYFQKLTKDTWISNYEKEEVGFAPSDLSHYKEKDLKEEYDLYLQDKNDFNKYDESTNELVED